MSCFFLYLLIFSLCRFVVDDVPIRVFKNNKAIGIPYPNNQPVGIYSTIFNGENWATNNGWVKLNWTMAPFVVTYEGFSVDACQVQNDVNITGCLNATGNWWDQPLHQSLNSHQIQQLKWVRNNYLQYDYCIDRSRYSNPPPECWNYTWISSTMKVGSRFTSTLPTLQFSYEALM